MVALVWPLCCGDYHLRSIPCHWWWCFFVYHYHPSYLQLRWWRSRCWCHSLLPIAILRHHSHSPPWGRATPWPWHWAPSTDRWPFRSSILSNCHRWGRHRPIQPDGTSRDLSWTGASNANEQQCICLDATHFRLWWVLHSSVSCRRVHGSGWSHVPANWSNSSRLQCRSITTGILQQCQQQ